MHHNYIIFSDEDHITDDPVFDIAVRIRSDVIEELKKVGVEDEALIDMLQAEWYLSGKLWEGLLFERLCY